MDILRRIFLEPLERSLDKLIQFLPSFFMALFLLIAGLILGLVLRALFSRVLAAAGLDRIADKLGIHEVLTRGGVKASFSGLVARMVQWFTIAVFIVLATQTMGIPPLGHLLEDLVLYIPKMVVAAVILFFGYLLADFFGRATLVAAVNAGVDRSRFVGRFVKLVVFLFAATMALEHLGIGRETVLVAFAIILGGVVLACAIAFGLGAQHLARDYLEKKARGEDREDEFDHL